jgi:hypothetical protein
MFDYAIQDVENRKNLYVAYETRDERFARTYAENKQRSDCEVYWETESNGKLFRVICTKQRMTSNEPRQVSVPR